MERRLLRHSAVAFALTCAVLLAAVPAHAAAPTKAWQVTAGGSALDRVRGLLSLADGSTIVTGNTRTATFGANALTGLGDNDAFVARMRSDGTFMWVRQYGGAGDDQAWGAALAADGLLRISGYYTGNATFGATAVTGAGGTDVFVAAVDPANGDVRWISTGGGVGFDYVYRARVYPDGSTVLVGSAQQTASFGSTTLPAASGLGDWWVARVNADGAYRWVKRVGGSTNYDDPFGFEIAPDGGIVATGYHGNNATFGTVQLTASGSSDITVMKLDADGVVQWARGAGGTSDDFSNDIATLPDGSVIVAGYFRGTNAVFGATQLTSAGGQDAFVARYSSSGDLVWVVRGGGTGDDTIRDIVVRADGTLLAALAFTGTATFGTHSVSAAGGSDTDLGIVAVDAATGAFLWAVATASSGSDAGRALSTLPDGSILVGGHLTRTTYGSPASEDVVVERWLMEPDAMDPPDVVRAPDGTEATATITPLPGDAITEYVVDASPGTRDCAITPPALSCTIRQLDPATTYTFTASATNAAGTSTSDPAPAVDAPPADGSTVDAPAATPAGSPGAPAVTLTATRGAIRLTGRSWRRGLDHHTAGRVPDGVTSVSQTIVRERGVLARFTRAARATMTVRCPITRTGMERRYRCSAVLAAGVWRITTNGRAPGADVTGFSTSVAIRSVPHPSVTG